ncbi:MAG: tRNA (N(6)-L-threonylcarbamoyladenosine(37)-C(2))-methylthiotransferase MtaB [Parasphingorhabdus sp.]|nr:tRNA (N(6)-L-threonylcarbamoyladenosine(37)-C(2))-methylthiotransferase MtaB [Parasphingorhabdus sp.]
MSAPEVITLGCRLNIAESDALRKLLVGRDDLIIVNSCAVTNEAVRHTRQAIRRAKRAHPEKTVMVTGCAAQIDPQRFAAMPEVAGVIGNHDKYDRAAFLFDEGIASSRVSDIMAVRETAPHMVSAFADRTRAFVEIQNGCDHRCTFCIIPFGRGNSRSVPAGAVVDHIAALVERGFAEVVLTGVDVTSYGADLPGSPTLGMLVARILEHVPQLRRLRLSSLDGIEIDARLFELLTQHERVMPHVHLSLQAGDDMILKRMKRRHSAAQAIKLVERLKVSRPEIAIGADIIAGFPTEDDAMFARSLALIDECQIVHAHVFAYSAKDGTPAARMPQVDGGIVKARAKALREKASAVHDNWKAALIGTRQSVLVENDGKRGHAENFAAVTLDRPAPPGSVVAVTLSLCDGALIGSIAA